MATWFHDLETNGCWHWKSQHVEIDLIPNLNEKHEGFTEYDMSFRFIDFHAISNGMYVAKDLASAQRMAVRMAHDTLMEFRDTALEADIEIQKEMKRCRES